MSELVIYGSPLSNYVRSVRLACEEKGVAYDLEVEGHNSIETLRSDAHRALHPFARIPAATHGDKVIYETTAIMRYVDEAFDGPALQPSGVYERAVMEQWISAGQDYINDAFRKGIMVNYVFPSGPEGQPDRAAIEAAAVKANDYAKVMDHALADRAFLAGDTPTLPDYLILPILIGAWNFPEGKAAMETCHNIGRWYATLSERPSVKATDAQAQAAA